MNAASARQAEQARELAALRIALRTIHNIVTRTSAIDDHGKVQAVAAVTDQYYGWRQS